VAPTEAPLSTETAEVPQDEAVGPAEATVQSNEAALAAKRYREMQRAKAREEKTPLLNQSAPTSAAPPPSNVVADSAKPGPKKVTVTVTYDESGRVTQASGGDASAVRIARQKRFPAGKAGSATITIPIN
ncbi:MAG: energy transducer TonB, partial [Acidobacteriota bacterium]|nr:energy transducer TonB [Acidobacteriota bacterium]